MSPPMRTAQGDPNVAIEVHSLSKNFGAFRAVDAVSFHVERGEIFGYLGANGAGKSTTIRMLCGLLQPDGGDAFLAGRSVRADPEGVKTTIGYMSQKFSLYPELKVRENLEFFAGAYGLGGRLQRERVAETLALVDLTNQSEARTADLPGGMRQRVALGGAILHRPPILFLDEPTAGVDPGARRRFWSLIQSLSDEGTTIFVTTHYLDEAELCQRVGLMVGGRLVALDRPSALKSAHVPGQMWSSPKGLPPQERQRLEKMAGVRAVATMGAGLRVRTGPEVDREDLGRLLPELRADAATLEDVFLAVVAQDPT